MHNYSVELRTRWYLVANRLEATVYRGIKNGHFQFVERWSNPLGDKREKELDSDRSGSGNSSAKGTGISHALDRRAFQHEHVAKKFSRSIARSLNQARAQGRFDELVVAAEPHFLGLLRAALSAPLRKIVRHEITREFVQGGEKQIRSLIMNELRKAS